MRDLTRLRNFGIIAHIDAGKTTVSERMLFVSGETHTIGDTHDGNTVLDHQAQERDRGITIGAAATTLRWNDHQLNLVDTPGDEGTGLDSRLRPTRRELARRPALSYPWHRVGFSFPAQQDARKTHVGTTTPTHNRRR